ncbi:hypothetical protein RKE29_16905, partial [Streptomyces sp. B1866]|uniref:hypothetical protein n=1 Tax=Streptomyces sp. B1866 TaxID=3075431 RepID=UPI00288F4BCD
MSAERRQRPWRGLGGAPLYLVPASYEDADRRAARMLEAVARATEAANVARAHRLLQAPPPSGTAAAPLDSGGAPFVLREYA